MDELFNRFYIMVDYGWNYLCWCLFIQKKTKKHNYLSWKYVQMITYILSMLLGYIVVFMFSQLWNDYKWKCSALAGTIILIAVVKIVRCFWNSIWKTNNRNI